MAWLMASRRRVAAFTILLLALLDLGRSAYARIGYATEAMTFCFWWVPITVMKR